MKRMVKLYLLGLLLCLLSALFRLMGFLGELVTLSPDLDPFPSGPRMPSEGGSPRALGGQGRLQTHKAMGPDA